MAIYSSDPLDAANGVNIIARSGVVGASWSYHPAYSGALLFQSNGVYPTDSVLALASGIPSTSEYTVSATILNVDSTISIGICGRWHPTLNTGYYTYHTGGQFHLLKAENGTLTNLSSVNYSWANGVELTVTLDIKNNLKQVLINGASIGLQSTDNTISHIGRVGIRSGAGATTTTGKRIQNFLASDNTLQISDSATIGGVDRVVNLYKDSGTLGRIETITRTGFMALDASGELDKKLGSTFILGQSQLGTAASQIYVAENLKITLSITRNDNGPLSTSRVFSVVSKLGHTDIDMISATETFSSTSSYPTLLNDNNTDDIRKRSGDMHYAVSRRVRQPFTIAYEHSGIYSESLPDLTRFVVLDANNVPIDSGTATTNWITGITTIVFDMTIDEELVRTMGLKMLLVG